MLSFIVLLPTILAQSAAGVDRCVIQRSGGGQQKWNIFDTDLMVDVVRCVAVRLLQATRESRGGFLFFQPVVFTRYANVPSELRLKATKSCDPKSLVYKVLEALHARTLARVNSFFLLR